VPNFNRSSPLCADAAYATVTQPYQANGTFCCASLAPHMPVSCRQPVALCGRVQPDQWHCASLPRALNGSVYEANATCTPAPSSGREYPYDTLFLWLTLGPLGILGSLAVLSLFCLIILSGFESYRTPAGRKVPSV